MIFHRYVELPEGNQWFGGSDKRNGWGIHIPFILPISMGSWLELRIEFPKHLIFGEGLLDLPIIIVGYCVVN